MSQLDPTQTSVSDLCTASLVECGAFGIGRTPLPSDLLDTQARMQWMLQQWERKRFLVWHLVTYSVISNGSQAYPFGPGVDPAFGFNTGISSNRPWSAAFNDQFGGPEIASVRPAKIESGFVRQIQMNGGGGSESTDPWSPAFNDQFGPLSNQTTNLGGSNEIDYPLEILQSKEDYNRIRLKSLVAGPGYVVYYDPQWPIGSAFIWPIPQANLYSIHLTVMEQLPPSFGTDRDGSVSKANLFLPYEYYAAIVYQLALRNRPRYGISTYPGDPLPGMAKDALNVLRPANAQIQRLQMPKELMRQGIYNIFSDSSY